MHLLPHTDHDVAINFCASEVFRVSDADAIIGPAAAAWLAEPEDSPRRLWFAGVVQRYSQQGNASVPGACMPWAGQQVDPARG
jgi:hypothetical protein